MPEPVWYYARGEMERGPFTSLQIKALAHAGKLRRDDLVWKEGMENWTAADEVAELFPRETSAEQSGPDQLGQLSGPSHAIRANVQPQSARMSSDVARLLTSTGWGCLVVGVACIVLARGCESLGHRKIARLAAAATLEADEAWQRLRTPLATEMKSLQGKGKLAPAELDRLRDLTQLLSQLDAARGTEEQSANWRLGVSQATAELRAGAFLHGMAFHGGIGLLALGGLALAFLGTGSDRWLGVGVVLVVCFAALSPKVAS